MAIRELIGTLKCLNPHCTAEVPVKRGEGGAVSASCPYCDLSAYGKAGTDAQRDILAAMKPVTKPAPIADPAPAPAPKKVSSPAPSPTPPAAPDRPARSTIFG